jgi:hypothetical protein
MKGLPTWIIAQMFYELKQVSTLHLHPPQVRCIQPLKLAGFTGYIYKAGDKNRVLEILADVRGLSQATLF